MRRVGGQVEGAVGMHAKWADRQKVAWNHYAKVADAEDGVGTA